ncbi:MAG TPA: hypothetical protein VKH64_02245 [Candidatus Binatia bacterium]|nr:hypothetical protein [Candidatus Binatia bacterium]
MKRITAAFTGLTVGVALLAPLPVRAADPIETAGVVTGVTAGNTIAVPAKIVSVGTGLIAGALSFILTGGNADLTRQIWSDVTEGPWYISPALARRAVGERPELEKRKAGMVETTPAVETQPAPADSPSAP